MGMIEPKRAIDETRPPVLDYAGPTVERQVPKRPFYRNEQLSLYVLAMGLMITFPLYPFGGPVMVLGGVLYCVHRIGTAKNVPAWAKAILIPATLGLLTGLICATGIDGLPILGAWTLVHKVGWQYAEHTEHQITWLVVIAVCLVVIVGTWCVMRWTKSKPRNPS